MPAIVIGIGGIGGAIVNDLRRRIEASTVTARDIRLLLVDTTIEGTHRLFDASSVFVIPHGHHRFDIDRRIRSFYETDPFFSVWWPTGPYGPFLSGDIDGTGGIRLKGKLAYRLHVAEPNRVSIADAVTEIVNRFRNALEPSEDSTQIPIYLVASLGGGTGSGIVPTLAHHLRMVLPSNCPLIGAFSLADVTALASNAQGQEGIWANTDAALREIDFFQVPGRAGAKPLQPFFSWPGEGNVVTGDVPPFQFIYLFGRSNRNGFILPAFGDYVQLIAGCLAAATSAPMVRAIDGPNAQFVQRFNELPVLYGRSTRYASAGIARIVFPAERVGRHLARRFGAQLLRERFLARGAPGSVAGADAAIRFLTDHEVLWDRSSLGGRQPLAATGVPAAPTLEMDTFLRVVGATASIRYVHEAQHRFLRWRDESLIPGLQQAGDAVIGRLAGSQGAIAALVGAELVHPSGEGYARARAAIDRLAIDLREQRDRLRQTIDGVDDRGGLPGLVARVEANRANETDAQRRLQEGFGPFHPRGKVAKHEFKRAWWDPFAEDEQRLHEANAALRVTERLLDTVLVLQQSFARCDDLLSRLVRGLETAAARDLAPRDHDDPLTLLALADAAIVNQTFGHTLEYAARTAGERIVLAVLTGQGGVCTVLRRVTEWGGDPVGAAGSAVDEEILEPVRSLLLDLTQEQFSGEVGHLSIWDALKFECEARCTEPELHDDALESALDALRHRIDDLRQQDAVNSLDTDRFVLQQYLRNTLMKCSNWARPFWNLDTRTIVKYALSDVRTPYQIAALTFDHAAYGRFVRETGIDDVVATLADTFARQSIDLPGHQTITFYAREGNVPLFFLDEDDLRQLRQSAEIAVKTRWIYTDARFESVIDRLIAPGDS